MDASWSRAALAAGLMTMGLSFGTGSTAFAQGRSAEYCPPEEPHRWSEEWYAIEADSPVGARQKYKKGKLWPPFPRPQGKEQQLSHRFHAAHYWPFPYRCKDRDYIRDLSQMQTAQGWLNETTLYDFHFDPESQELNHAGRLQLRWIMETAPVQYRQVSVQSGSSIEQSQIRVQSTTAEAIQMAGADGIPPIGLRITSATGRPAVEINQIRRLEFGSMPNPRIQYTTGGGSAGSGGGGAAAAGGM